MGKILGFVYTLFVQKAKKKIYREIFLLGNTSLGYDKEPNVFEWRSCRISVAEEEASPEEANP